MRKLILAAVCAAAALSTVTAADASGGCGPAFHRGPYGGCRPNRGPYVVAPGLIVGGFYPGHGYWYGGRYWGHRYRWRHGWRYR